MSAQNFYDLTGWSTIRQAQGDDTVARDAARERLLARYRPLIIMEIRQRAGASLGDAEDLAQQFLHDALKRDFLMEADPARGRFRSFIKTCIDNFLKDQWDRDQTAKRGGGEKPLSLDETGEDGRPVYDPPHPATPHPGAGLDREWAKHIVNLSLSALQEKFTARRRGPIFQVLKTWLTSDPTPGQYAVAAHATGIKEDTLRVTVTRMREDFHRILVAEVKQTVPDGGPWEDELRYLLGLL